MKDKHKKEIYRFKVLKRKIEKDKMHMGLTSEYIQLIKDSSWKEYNPEIYATLIKLQTAMLTCRIEIEKYESVIAKHAEEEGGEQ